MTWSSPLGSGRCKDFASDHGARNQTSRSSSVLKITGIAFSCTLATTSLGLVVKKAKTL